MDILKYRGYEGTAEIDMDRMVCRGKILFIDDLVTYEAEKPADLQKEFEEAVDDYLETCAELGREAQKPHKGQFNVRVRPEQHKAAILRAHKEGVKLNEIVVKALDAYLSGKTDINHNINLNLQIPEEAMKKMVASPSSGLHWEKMTNVLRN
jgi:predicted HicB family RNase H-like nuclease